jgi:RNA polymerase sigma factor (sigma-70 family)
MDVPPFERFYLEHRDEIHRRLVRLVGRDGADDAFQETFLRALRGYPKLAHGEHLRAWVHVIAERVAYDQRRRGWQRELPDVPDLETVDEPLLHDELKRLTAGLPPKERAAVFLRYGYDLTYAEIGAAIGSNADAARQAASSGVRRLRKEQPR